MSLTHRLDLKHTQSLVMTPQLQQAIKLLQMSNVELTAYVEEEMQQNPLLEREDSEGRAEPEAQSEMSAAADAAPEAGGFEDEGENPADSLDLHNADSIPADGDAPLDTDYGNVWEGDASTDAPAMDQLAYDAASAGGGGRTDFADADDTFESQLTRERTLRDHLVEQLNVDFGDVGDRMIGLHLIDSLDGAGRAPADLAGVAEQLDCTPQRVEEVLLRMQTFDPSGIFARDLKECFEIQLREKDRLDPAMQALLDNLHLFERYDRTALLKACGVDDEDFDEMLAELRALNPKPATIFDHEVAQPVVPDIIMRPLTNGGWQVELNSETLPRVLVNQQYYSRIVRGASDRKAQEYLNEQLNSANWLVKALHQRATTILKVATEIVRQQDAFFVHGVAHMRPLILRDIAEAISMHESTISRVTNNKYMATPRGICELKYFFSSALSNAHGGMAHSAEAVRFRIKTLCDAETADTVLSDDDIAARLRADGIDIARRTVAKYREAMNIPSSVRRRRMKTGRM